MKGKKYILGEEVTTKMEGRNHMQRQLICGIKVPFGSLLIMT